MKAWILLGCLVFSAVIPVRAQDADEFRKLRETLMQAGGWKEALEVYKKNLAAVSDANSGEDLERAVDALQKLDRIEEADGLVEGAVAAHPDNASVLIGASRAYRSTVHSGSNGGGEFRRGFKEPVGPVFSTSYRDRVRSIQLLRRALDLPLEEAAKAGAWRELAQVIDPGESWKMQVLTPLDKLPEWDEPGPSGGTEGVPWTADGPFLVKVPESWEKAANDGERWRYALGRWAASDDAADRAVRLAYAGFLETQFGREALQPWRDADGAAAVKELERLADDEMIARTSDGIKRFKLPADQNFIEIYRSLFESGKVEQPSNSLVVVQSEAETAGDSLASVYRSRGQYVKAAATLKEVIAKFGEGPDGSRGKMLAQFTGKWGSFEAPSTVPAGTKPVLPVVFRNGTEISFTAAPVDMSAVLRDMIAYLKGNPVELNHEVTNPSAVAYRLLTEKESAYIGQVAAEWTQALQPEEGHRSKRQDVEMPVDKAGAWWVTGKMKDGNTFHTLVWIVDTVIAHREVAGNRQWWVADAESGAPVPDADVLFFGYEAVGRERKTPQERRFDVMTEEVSAKTDEDGKVLQQPEALRQQMQWIAVATKEGRAGAFFGFQQFMAAYPGVENGNRDIGYGITDRPAYKPGDTIHMKFFLRNVGYFEPDEAKYANREGTLVLFDGRGQEALKIPNVRTDELGAAEVKAVIPENAPMGRWRAAFSIADQISESVTFRVEEYRKPEYEVSVEAPGEPVRLGDKFSVKVKAAYFHGAPVREASVRILVKREPLHKRWFPAMQWDWLYGEGAWWPSADASWHPGWRSWNCIPDPRGNRWTPEEIVLERTLKIGADGTASVEIDTRSAKEIHGDMDAKYEIEAFVTDASRREERASGSVIAALRPFEAVVWANRGFAAPGDEVEATVSAATLDGRPVAGAEGTLRLLKISLGEDGKLAEREVLSWPVKSGDDGVAMQKFAAPEAGQYRLSVELSKDGGERVSKAVILNIHGAGPAKAEEWQFGAIELTADKMSYQAGDTMKLRINSDRAGAHVWLFLHINGASAREARRIILDGKSLEVEVPLDRRDMPNMFVEAVTVHGSCIHTTSRQVLLPPEKKMIEVSAVPEKAKVAPGSSSSLKISLRDADGNPVAGKAVVAVYDKALEAFAGGPNVAPVEQAFWGWANYYVEGRSLCSAPVSPGNLVAPGDAAMWELDVDDSGLAFGGVGAAGGLSARALESAVPAPAIIPAADGFADGGGLARKGAPAEEVAPIQVRKDFADLLKWVGSVTADADGTAEVPLEFPDNLTTWKARVWIIGSGTRVGEGSAEIVATKDLLVRPHFPRFLVERDEAVIGAVVHNEHAVAKTVEVSLELGGGAVEAISGKPVTVTVDPKGEARVEWKVKAVKEGVAKVKMTARASDDGDAVERDLPVLVHGMSRQDAWSVVIPSGKDSVKIPVEVPGKVRPGETKLVVRYSPTVAGAVVDAVPYLASYPHGCTEQTLNRFLPAVIARKLLTDLGIDLEEVKRKRTNLNPQELGDSRARAEQWKQWEGNPVFDGRELDRIVRTGTERLVSMQNADGGWGWFSGFGEKSYPHTTAVVMHGLSEGRAAGVAVNDGVHARGMAWLAEYEKNEVAALKRYIARAEATSKGEKLDSGVLPEKAKADPLDAFVRKVLGQGGNENPEMKEFLFRDRLDLPVYAQALFALELHRQNDVEKRDQVMHVISQFLKRDPENQTAWLDTGRGGWWYWYGSTVEANAWYLKLLAAVKPADEDTRGLAKYLVNNRKGGNYWSSTRDTAYAIEALCAYAKNSGEMSPDMKVEVLLGGKTLRETTITRENLFSFDGTVVLGGEAVAPGRHEIEIRRSGGGTLYANAYLEVFSLEDRFRPAGLEVKVERKLWKLVAEKARSAVPDQTGQVVLQDEERMKRVPLEDGAALSSGDRVEVELIIDSKNDYEYLMFSDAKAAGFEAVDALSGYTGRSLHAYMEPRDRSVDFFVAALPRGKHSIRYELRAESPGSYKAMPAEASAMYAPELRGNSADFRLQIRE